MDDNFVRRRFRTTALASRSPSVRNFVTTGRDFEVTSGIATIQRIAGPGDLLNRG